MKLRSMSIYLSIEASLSNPRSLLTTLVPFSHLLNGAEPPLL